MQDLALPRDWENEGNFYALAINKSDQVVGYSDSGEMHAFLWTSKNGMQDLGTQGYSSRAYDINGAGKIVGRADAEHIGSVTLYHACIWEPAK
jgi:probable HAF family extracellular repeat protein